MARSNVMKTQRLQFWVIMTVRIVKIDTRLRHTVIKYKGHYTSYSPNGDLEMHKSSAQLYCVELVKILP